MSKADYVREQSSIGRCPITHPKGFECSRPKGHAGNHQIDAGHGCHWPGCTARVPPAMWGCKPHWFRLPVLLRRRIWATYVPGQEITKTPSPEYVVAAQAVQDWIGAQ